jgi:hypothetical protein
MVRRVVRFFLGGQRKGLSAEGQTHQQEDQQCSHRKRTTASRLGWSAGPKQGHADAMAARSYAFRLAETPQPRRAAASAASKK